MTPWNFFANPQQEYEVMTRPGSAMTMSDDETELRGARPFNQRIGLLSEEGGEGDGERTWTPRDGPHFTDEHHGFDANDDDDDDDADVDDEVTRDQIKRASSAILAAAERSSRRKTKKKGSKDSTEHMQSPTSTTAMPHSR